MAVLPFRLLTAATTGLSFSTPVCPSRQHRVAGGGRLVFSSISCRAVAAGGPITITGDPPTFVSAPGRRIVAVGDLHGDLYQTRAALVMAGVLSLESDAHVWTGGQTILVQVGDILDRGEDEIAILSLLSSLNVQAKSQGGAVFQVNGNHETMNVEGDFRSKEEYRTSLNGDWLPLNFIKKQKGFACRASLFKQGGPLACELARHPVILNVNDWIFCHGGLLPHHVAYGIERINAEVSNWMQGSSEDSDDPDLPFIATRGYDSVVWTRLYSQDLVKRTQRSWNLSSVIAEQTLKSVGAKGMVVGHTPQNRGVNCKCDGKVWCVDVGMSYGVLHSRPEVLEIVNDRPRVLKEQRNSYDEMEVLDYL
ncbi:hypothetical protein ACQ4PT_047760 [Festuca glaucescens]